MTPDRRSRTASIVCVARGIGISYLKRDPAAEEFAPRWLKSSLRAMGRDTLAIRAMRFALRAMSLGLIDHNTARMLMVDNYVREWIGRSCQQLVIVGAGLDARSWRMPELRQARVFELDNSLTQAIKAQSAAVLRPLAARVNFLRVDLEQDDLAQPLLQAGYSAAEPAAWVCEGVTPYLDLGTIARLLKNAAATSADGSKFVVSYVAPVESKRATLGRSLVRRLVASLGEPAGATVPMEDMGRLLEEAGLELIEDLAWSDWLQRLDLSIRLPNLFRERLLVAEKGVR